MSGLLLSPAFRLDCGGILLRKNIRDGQNLKEFLKKTISCVAGVRENKKPLSRQGLSGFVGVTGFEPATPSTPRKCATGLRHTPKRSQFEGAKIKKSRITYTPNFFNVVSICRQYDRPNKFT
jgi:hypothetical protein